MGGARMNVAGIDYSSRYIDLVLLHLDDQHSPMWFRYELSGADAFDRTRTVADAMPGRASDFWDDILAVGIEHPGGHHGTRDMLRVQGAVLSCIPARMLVHPLPPGKWRKLVGLPGNASKTDVRLFATYDHRNIVSDGWPNDATDAYCIALATRSLIEQQAAA